jgi:hypothetical protein
MFYELIVVAKLKARKYLVGWMVCGFNPTFNNISAIAW